ncbi:hypothetical protein [Stomatohabitans albus]|uniref:hypothetical protein n=1 Tax=Stomatohabitans albus TaxID=3110766 RepID=UPI00300C6A9B
MDTTGLGNEAQRERSVVWGHSYTAAYRYQLVMGKVGGWAIPYPLTIPQAVTGLTTVVSMMITASWWYPLTGVSGAVAAIIAPVLGMRFIARIRPEGRAVADWVQGSLRGFTRYYSPGIVLDVRCVHQHLSPAVRTSQPVAAVHSLDKTTDRPPYPSHQRMQVQPARRRSRPSWLPQWVRRNSDNRKGNSLPSTHPIPMFDPWVVSPSIQSEER